MVAIAENILAAGRQVPRLSELRGTRNALAAQEINNQLGRQSLGINADQNRRANALATIAQDENRRANELATRQQSIYDTEEAQTKLRQMYEGALVAQQNPAAIPSFIQMLKDMGEIKPEFTGEGVGPHEMAIMVNGLRARIGQDPLGMSQIGNPDIPSNVRNALYYSNLDTAGRENYEAANRQRQLLETGGGTAVLGPQGAQVVPGAEAGALATRAANEAGAIEAARQGAGAEADLAVQTRERNAAYQMWTEASNSLSAALSSVPTGPVEGRVPAELTGERLGSAIQIADGAVAAISPILKQLFRTAGEGTFTDRDQALLLEMIPDRETHPAARDAQIQAIDQIVRAKLGITGQSPQAPTSAPAAVAPQSGGLPRVTTESEWAALPAGTQYIDPEGNARTKR